MKRSPRPVLAFTASAFLSTALLVISAASVKAQDPVQRITGAFVYPTAAERFFREGRDRLEVEIHRLQQNPKIAAVLQLDPNILQQQQLLQQQEPLLENGLLERSDSPPDGAGDRSSTPELPTAPRH